MAILENRITNIFVILRLKGWVLLWGLNLREIKHQTPIDRI